MHAEQSPLARGRKVAAGTLVAAIASAIAVLPAGASTVTPHVVTPQVVTPKLETPPPAPSPAPNPAPTPAPAPAPAPTPTADSGPARVPQPQGDDGPIHIPTKFPGYPWDLPNPWSPDCDSQCTFRWNSQLQAVEHSLYLQQLALAKAGDLLMEKEFTTALDARNLVNLTLSALPMGDAENLVGIALSALPGFPTSSQPASGSEGGGGGIAGWLERLKAMFKKK